jgi:hypothetical protein
MGQALSSSLEMRKRLPRMVRRLPGYTSTSGRPLKPCTSIHAAQSARAAAATSSCGAHRGGGQGWAAGSNAGR